MVSTRDRDFFYKISQVLDTFTSLVSQSRPITPIKSVSSWMTKRPPKLSKFVKLWQKFDKNVKIWQFCKIVIFWSFFDKKCHFLPFSTKKHPRKLTGFSKTIPTLPDHDSQHVSILHLLAMLIPFNHVRDAEKDRIKFLGSVQYEKPTTISQRRILGERGSQTVANLIKEKRGLCNFFYYLCTNASTFR